ncbi:hypothetical protein [Anditalea andensis]|uniref:Membrane protein n=1 Tax=Anditalea andensis TaxID=1048983 RepID=A0A074KSR8_9BACT|nr:hypothetical protein [Anditalea andensis]KEO71969.1 membrane protein [Anditalea andensis]
MQDKILPSINDPRQLEKLYRENKSAFKQAFTALYPKHKGQPLADFWNERLHYDTEDINWGNTKEILAVVSLSILAGLIAKIPAILSIWESYFYPRNIGFILFPILAGYFAWKNKLHSNKIIFIILAMLIGVVYINLLPNEPSDTLSLACIHILLYLWAILGFAYVGDHRNIGTKRIDFLKYNGDLIVMTSMILLAGGLMSAVTVGLFSILGFNIEKFYGEYIAIIGLAASPVLATYLSQKNPSLVGKISPVIAKIFSPLVLVMLIIYLVAMLFSKKDPYNDREFLIIFNVLLIGVMAIIFFSVVENNKLSKSQIWILLLLSIVTIIVNSIALSAILFRIWEFGLTPNRGAVLGSNLLILINLLLVTVRIFKTLSNPSDTSRMGKTIATYLPVYFIWAILVTFLFPLIFDFK